VCALHFCMSDSNIDVGFRNLVLTQNNRHAIVGCKADLIVKQTMLVDPVKRTLIGRGQHDRRNSVACRKWSECRGYQITSLVSTTPLLTRCSQHMQTHVSLLTLSFRNPLNATADGCEAVAGVARQNRASLATVLPHAPLDVGTHSCRTT